MAEMARALLDDELTRLLAVAQHRDLARVLGHLDRRCAALIAGCLGLLVDNIVGTVLVDERAAGHQLHGIRVAPLLHRALDGDQIVFFHGYASKGKCAVMGSSLPPALRATSLAEGGKRPWPPLRGGSARRRWGREPRHCRSFPLVRLNRDSFHRSAGVLAQKRVCQFVKIVGGVADKIPRGAACFFAVQQP